MKALRILLFPLLLLLSGALHAASDVCRFTIPKAVAERWGIEIVLFHRDGSFHNGYALVPGRERVPHRVDITPSKPIQWQKADGTPYHVPNSLRGYYSYKHKDFRRNKELFAAGKIKVAHHIPTGPIAWKDGKLSGFVDVKIGPVNISTSSGRGPYDTPYRIRIEAAGKMGGALTGNATWWNYDSKDDDYGKDAKKTTVKLESARWDPDYWAPAEGTDFAAGTDWPQARGPMLNGSAADCKRPFVENLGDARLQWVGEEIIGGGRGAVLSRGGFAMYPYAWQNISFGSFAGVTVADGKVFQYLVHPDEKRVAADEAIAKNVYVHLGADPRTLANSNGHMRDTVLCLDARTGKTLWWFKSERTFGGIASGKGGIGMTACFHKGKVYARGSGGLYCLDANSGKLLWNKGGATKGKAKVGYGPSSGWSHDESPVIVGGVLVIGHGKDEALAGISPADGSLLWTHSQVKGQNAVPTKVVLEGQEYIIVCGKGGKGGKGQKKLSLIEPSAGKILWQNEALGPNHASLSVWGDVVCGNGADRKKQKQGAATAVRVSLKGVEKLWSSEKAGYPPSRSVPVAYNKHFYIDDRRGFSCLDVEKGAVVNRMPQIYNMSWGSHNWVWTIVGNQRVITSGVLMFSAADGGFKRMPGRISLYVAGGYTCPIKPAMADGRLFCRLGDKIVCYDLRQDPKEKIRTIELTATGAFASSRDPSDAVQVRVRVKEGKAIQASARWPEVVGPEAKQSTLHWIAGYKRALAWRSYPIAGLKMSGDTLSGEMRLPMGWHFEHWKLELARTGETFDGTYTRSVPAVRKPVSVKGAVEGKSFDYNGSRCHELRLDAGATQLKGGDPQAVTVAVVIGGKGRRGWAAAGKVNGIAHEVDPSKLTIGNDGKVTGKLTIIFRNDSYFHMNQDAQTAVAATYEIDAALKDGKITGTHSGTVGLEWSRSGKMSGKFVR